ncbi:MAG: hypothetical protein JKP92_04325 [Alphaproteobacteria bacterium]|jgi:hypothetical protein|nr:hypothetical protein [Alphaproteobacteria bacterium]
MAQRLARAPSYAPLESLGPPESLAQFCISLAARAGAALATRRLANTPVAAHVTDPQGHARSLALTQGVEPCRTRSAYLLVVGTVARAVEALAHSGLAAPGTRVEVAVRTQFGEGAVVTETRLSLAIAEGGVVTHRG